MDNQTVSGTEQPHATTNASASSNANPPKAKRPVPVAQSTSAADKSPKIASRKGAPSKKGKRAKARRPEGSTAGAGAKAKATKGSRSPANAKGIKGIKGIASARRRPKGKARFSRKQFLIGLIAIVLIFDVGVISLWYFGNRSGPPVPPNPDPYSLIQGQMSNNRSIAEVGYDSALTFANYPNLTIVNTASLKPIENNLLRAEGAPDGKDSLYDEQIVGRVLKLNSDWVNYLNRSDRSAFDSVQEGSAAETKIGELGAESLVAYHRLAIGEIRHSGKNYYLITQASYTLTKDGQLDLYDDLFVYKLVAQGNTMLVADFERIPVGSPQEQPVDTPTDDVEGEQPVDDTGDGTAEEPIEGNNEESGEEPTEEPIEEPTDDSTPSTADAP
jgi:hypothetical protein